MSNNGSVTVGVPTDRGRSRNAAGDGTPVRPRITTFVRAGRVGASAPILIATVVLFALSPTIVEGSLGAGPLATMMPFAAILAIAAVGQTLVIQQGGIDFSVASTISLSAVVVTKYAEQDASRVAAALLVVVAIAAFVGLTNGLLVTRLGVTPIIATLGVNALVNGAMRRYSGGLAVPPAPVVMKEFALGRTLGIYNPVVVAGVTVLLGSLVLNRSVLGRRYESAGANPIAAHALGLRTQRYRVGAYVSASLCYALAGVLLASVLNAPRIDAGEPYLLASIAAAVIGGTSLTGGAGTLVGAAFGALFLTQLAQLLLGSGLDTAVIFIVQGGVIALSMAARTALAAIQRSRAARRALSISGATGSEREAELDDSRATGVLR